jgi:hypothetical protein
VSPAVARVIRGRLLFARCQAFGRESAPALRAIGRVADSQSPAPAVVRAAVAALGCMLRILRACRPRTILASWDAPIRLFTDGACEPAAQHGRRVSVGAVLFPPRGPPVFWGVVVPPSITRAWADADDAQVIAQAELLPVLLSKLVWADVLRDRPLLVFVDNDGARHKLVGSSSTSEAAAAIVGASSVEDGALGCHQWVARVPTCANIADGPSRLDFGAVLRQGGRQARVPPFGVVADWPALQRLL